MPERGSRGAAPERRHVPKGKAAKRPQRQSSSYTQCDPWTAMIGARLLKPGPIGGHQAHTPGSATETAEPFESEGRRTRTAGRPGQHPDLPICKPLTCAAIIETARRQRVRGTGINARRRPLCPARAVALATSERPHTTRSNRAPSSRDEESGRVTKMGRGRAIKNLCSSRPKSSHCV